ncbi:MAG: FixH family protein [Gammaproteobacteria bacterium]|nr:FixH family protein [Gammaproteobacteria bacterium]
MQVIEQSKAWHRYPMVWMMIAIPFSAVIMGVVMLWLAIDTDDGLVADDYYKLGLEINRVISRDKKATELGLSAVIEFDNDARIIRIQFDKGLLEHYPKILPLHLQHATRENSDLVVMLDHGMGDLYIGHVNQSISEGIWYFQLSDSRASNNGESVSDWKLSTRSRVSSKNTIHLRSKY